MKCKEVMEVYVAVCEANTVFQYLLNQWLMIEEISKILKIFYDFTIRLQHVDFTLSDLYGEWLLSDLKLQKMMANTHKTNLCEKFVWSMNKRKNDVIKNRAVLCAVFLDPRFRLNLTTSEMALVKHLLEGTWIDVKDLKRTEQANANVDGGKEPQETSKKDDDLLETFLTQQGGDLGRMYHII